MIPAPCQSYIPTNNVLGNYIGAGSVSFTCSCFGPAGGGGSAGQFGIYDWIATAGLSDVITNVTANSDGSYGLSMTDWDFTELYANTQQYFQSCGCADTGDLLRAWNDAVIRNTITIMIYSLAALQALGIIKADRTPVQGQAPNSVQTYPKPGGKTVRVFGSDGRVVRDIDYGSQAHSGYDPEVHDWNWSSGKPVRGPGRAPGPGEIP